MAPAAIMNERALLIMGGKDLEALFTLLKSLSEGLETLRHDLREIRTEIVEIRGEVSDNKRQLSVMEVNLDGVDLKITELKCPKHEESIRKVEDFVLTHDTKEKALFGIRADIIAWISLVGLLVAIAANYVKITEAKSKELPAISSEKK